MSMNCFLYDNECDGFTVWIEVIVCYAARQLRWGSLTLTQIWQL